MQISAEIFELEHLELQGSNPFKKILYYAGLKDSDWLKVNNQSDCKLSSVGSNKFHRKISLYRIQTMLCLLEILKV